MKIKLVLSILFLSVTMVVAQTRVSLNSKISFVVPEGTVKYNDTDYINKMKEAFGDQFTESVMKNTNVFKYENIKFTFKIIEKISANTIQNFIKSLDKVYGNNDQVIGKSKEKLYKEYNRNSKKIGDGEIVFATYREANKGVIKFYYYNSVQKVAFGGEIIYDMVDKSKSRQIFDTLCESIII